EPPEKGSQSKAQQKETYACSKYLAIGGMPLPRFSLHHCGRCTERRCRAPCYLGNGTPCLMLKPKVEAPDDLNPQETSEWIEALDEVIDQVGPDRASYLLDRLMERAANLGVRTQSQVNTPYINTIPPEDEVQKPGIRAIERNIKSLVRWNATAMVVRANKYDANIGGHLATYASLATLLEVGFNHFFRGSYGTEPGDFVYFQGHASPGVYARAFVEGRLSEKHLENFRHE